MKKKLLALFLAAAMVLEGTGIIQVQAEITDNDKNSAVNMTLNTEYSVSLDESEASYYKFTPTKDGVYLFESKGNNDTYGELYDSTGELICENDDGSGNGQFKIERLLNAGKTYYLKAFGYGYNMAEMSVYVKLSDKQWYVEYDSEVTVGYNKKADLDVKAYSFTGNKLTYQWYYYDEKMDIYVLDESNVNNKYTVTGSKDMCSGYKCYVSDGNNSQWCNFYVYLDTEIEYEYDSNVSVKYGESKTLEIFAVGGANTLNYQWYYANDDDGSNYIKIKGATGSKYTIQGNKNIHEKYLCTISDGMVIKKAYIYVSLDTGLRLASNDMWKTFYYGKENIMSVDAVGKVGTLYYQWYYYDDSDDSATSNWYKINGATQNTYKIPTNSKTYTSYKCVVTDGIAEEQCKYDISWKSDLSYKQYSYNYTMYEGMSKTLTMEATGGVGELSYQWYYYNEDDGEYYIIDDATTSSYQITADENIYNEYKCRVSDSICSTDSYFYVDVIETKDFYLDADNSLTKNEMFFKISGLEGANKIELAETNYYQYMKLYDADMNILSNSEDDYVEYIFDSEETYYLYAYCYGIESEDGSVAVTYEPIEFCAVAKGLSTIYVPYNEECTLEVLAECAGSEFSYQWYYDDDNGYSLIEGATANKYTIGKYDNPYNAYYCVVTNDDDESRSVYFNVNVDTNLKASILPSSSITVINGGTSNISVDASSLRPNLTYQWYSRDEDWNSTLINGATSNKYTLIGNANLAYSYYCVVSDGFNECTTESIYPELDLGLKIFGPENSYLGYYYGETVNLNVVAVGKNSNLRYEWSYYDESTKQYKILSGVNTSTYTFLAEEKSPKRFLCKVYDGSVYKTQSFGLEYYGEVKDISKDSTVTLEYSTIVEDGKAKEPGVTIKLDKKTLFKDRQYKVEYKNNVKPGVATVVIKGIGKYKGEIVKTFSITAKPPTAKPSIANATITLNKKSYVYDGKEKRPSVTVVLGGKTLVNGTDYTVSYTNNKNIGSATVTVAGKGNYVGTAKVSFDINIKIGNTYTVGAYKYKVTSKSEVAFAGVKKATTKNVVIAGTVKIGGKVFKVTSIANGALQKKTKVKSVTVGANIKKIGQNAFNGCKNLKTITIKSTKIKTVGKNALNGINSKAKIKVPSKSLKTYQKVFKGKGQGKKVKITK